MKQSHMVRCSLAILGLAMVIAGAALAGDEIDDDNEAPHFEGRYGQHFGGWRNGPPQFDQNRPDSPQHFDTGLVFFDGVYIPPPYIVATTEEGTTINGAALPTRVGGGFRFTHAPEGNGFRGARWGDQPRPNFGRRFSQMTRIVDCLESDGVLVAFSDEPLVSLLMAHDIYLFHTAVASRDGDLEARQELLQRLPPGVDRSRWDAWLADFAPPSEVLAMGASYVERYNAVEQSNMAAIAAVRRINTFSYPLTVFGMVAGVIALGHLLTSLPRPEAAADGQPVRPEWIRAAVISIALVLVLSALDLVWTILAHQAGEMRELNPLGSRLIADPLSLIAFKTSVTLASCGLLLALRRHHVARKAAWWACLVCTVLTFRWLVFNSMFVV